MEREKSEEYFKCAIVYVLSLVVPERPLASAN